MNNHRLVLSNKGKPPRFFYGYTIVLASFLILAIVGGVLFSFGVFLKPMINDFGWTRAAISGAYALNAVLVGFLSIFAGRINDRFGPRLVVTVCGFFIGLSYLLMSKVSTIWQIYLFFGVFLGIGIAGIITPVQSTVARWFIKRRGLATGIVMSGVGVGTIIMPPLANQLILSYSWRTSYFTIGLIGLVSIIVIAQFLVRNPIQKGLLAYGANAVQTDNSNLQIHGLSFREATRTRQFWLICIAYLFFSFCLQTVMLHVVPHATDIGIPSAAAATILSIIGILSIGGNIGMGSIGDMIGNRRVMIIVFMLTSLSLLWLSLATELWMLYLFAVVFGLGYGGLVAVQSPVVADFFDLRAHGTIFGLTMFASNFGGAIGSLMSGRIFDISGSYYWAFILCTILGIAGLILSILLNIARK